MQTPGPRLYGALPFKHLAQGAKQGSSRPVDVHLNVIPFVDMMTILVCFLLMVFSASGELISAQRGLVLPDATNKEILKRAPIIIVTRDTISFNGQGVGQVDRIMADEGMEWKIVELYDRLRQEKTSFKLTGFDKLPPAEKEYCTNPPPRPTPDQICIDGLLVLQADKDTPSKVLNRVLKTAYAAEYPNVMFAVNRRSSSAQ
ncbi:MAG TPA: biopolymer transporter ExbD [Kofleriaceae bacterium]|nr:biopolymer transporter ExbD [Kofleriaceae bacterium]